MVTVIMGRQRRSDLHFTCYGDVEDAVRRATTKDELCRVVEIADGLFHRDVLVVADDEWITLAALIRFQVTQLDLLEAIGRAIREASPAAIS